MGRGAAGLCVASLRAEDQPIGSATTADGRVRLDSTSLRRTEGDTATMRVNVVNNGNADWSITAGNLRWIDLAGRRHHEAGLSSSGCDRPPGRQLNCRAISAAPPLDTTSPTDGRC